MRGKIVGKSFRLAGASVEAAEEADGSFGVVAGDAGYLDGGRVGFEFLLAGVALVDELFDDSRQNRPENSLDGSASGE